SLIFSLVMKSHGTGWRSFMPEISVRSTAMRLASPQSFWARGSDCADAAAAQRKAARTAARRLCGNRPPALAEAEGDGGAHGEDAAGRDRDARPKAPGERAGREAAEGSEPDDGHRVEGHDAAAVVVGDEGLDGGVRRGHLAHHEEADDG